MSEIKATDIANVFGSNKSNFSSGTGYVLMYREYTQIKINSIDDSMISQEIKQSMEQEKIEVIEQEKMMKERLDKINLKFMIGEEEKTIYISKLNTTNQLKIKVMNEFKIDKDEKNVRIRVVNNNGRLLDTFPLEDKTIDDYSIYAYRKYSLEIRENENVPFDEYDPNSINILLCKWEDKYEEMEENDFTFDNLYINRQEPLSNLKNRIYDKFKIDRNKEIFCFKRFDKSIIELFKNSYELNKEIFLHAIFNESKLYLEIKENEFTISKFRKVKFLLN